MGMDVCLIWEGEEVSLEVSLLVDLYGNLEHVFMKFDKQKNHFTISKREK